ncbi:MAG: hypothetical protein VKI83_12400 [Synechococcaceae cyanobacterium]|nr:hypothetical protein [Synechococcaceae cyanobacterium]
MFNQPLSVLLDDVKSQQHPSDLNRLVFTQRELKVTFQNLAMNRSSPEGSLEVMHPQLKIGLGWRSFRSRSNLRQRIGDIHLKAKTLLLLKLSENSSDVRAQPPLAPVAAVTATARGTDFGIHRADRCPQRFQPLHDLGPLTWGTGRIAQLLPDALQDGDQFLAVLEVKLGRHIWRDQGPKAGHEAMEGQRDRGDYFRSCC